MRRGRRTIALLAFALVSLTTLAGVPAATAEDPPSLRVFTAATRIDIERDKHDFAYADLGAWIASVGGGFELRASRPDYTSPVGLVQVDAETGEVLRTLPADMMAGWNGLADFLHYSVKDADGKVLTRETVPFCPSTWYRARLNDEGPLNSAYPYFCGGMPLTRGTVWGIDDGWAVAPLAEFGVGFEAERRNFQARVWIDPAWVDLLGIAPEDAEARVHIRVFDRGTIDDQPPVPVPAAPTRSPRVPTTTNPDPAGLPDLIALPAWSIGTYARRGHDYLSFNATEWNAGPGTLVVEGFRGVDQQSMEAYQYFHVDGVPTGRAPIGSMEFHTPHGHWHFEEFTEYSLRAAGSGLVQLSGKQSWCLANTDAIDLSVPNANWGAFGGDLFTMCGGPGALWIREILDVGWGDTYGQFVPGQAFDVTNVPNGEYYIRVHVNPTGRLFEVTEDNNIVDRLIRLGGKPGRRTVEVPPWNGIDTEDWCYYCF